MYNIFLVEDDFALMKAMKTQIENYGNKVTCAENFQNITEEFSKSKPSLVLMDIMLPFKDGYYWCSEIRKISSIPIVFISSASDNMNIVMAINMGGDDFIAKPVEPMVLTAKIQAILRRTYEISDNLCFMEFDGAILNVSDSTVTLNGQSIELTKNELRILETLIENKGKIVSRNALMTKLWQNDCYVEENTLTVNVARLRKKLEQFGLKDVISTKTGSGYILK